MKIYGLIGNPLSHSFSRKYFLEKFQNENITDSDYLNFEVKDMDMEIPALRKSPLISGLNVTIPYKSQIIKFLDAVSPECLEIDACNCIKIVNGKWEGYNTDITGFEKSFLTERDPPHKKALILGTGGSSKAVAFVLKKLGIEFILVSSSKKDLPGIIHYEGLSKSIMDEYSIVINTTPVGMFPNTEDYPKIPYQYISEKHYFFDLIYNPSMTLFLLKAQERGARIKNGGDMLTIQAEESWKIWCS
jgi:shikimate dehydrogenase